MFRGFSRRWLAGTVVAALLASIGGCLVQAPTTPTYPEDRPEAWRFLSHATFGPSEADVADVTQRGYEAWIDQQFSMPLQLSYRHFVEKRNTEITADGVGTPSRPDQIIEGFYTRALIDPAQLRQRLVFALSEIFVVSMVDARLTERTHMMAGYIDTLDSNLLGTYRQLLEAVTKTPAMGMYLTYQANQKEDLANGRIPDENYAREVMQLFSIGLHKLNLDGTLVKDARGQPIETYDGDSVRGLAKVFTGWSNYHGPSFSSQSEIDCFFVTPLCSDPEAAYRPMISYPNRHSTSDATFLGVTRPAQGSANPEASLKFALDTLANHPNVAPFFSKQLIQRLVTSNPSPAYVARVAQRFLDTNGRLIDVVKAILLDPEALGSPLQAGANAGKVREPILRLTALLRAFKFDGPGLHPAGIRVKNVGITSTTDAAQSFGQSPWSSPSVFNYFRPGYVPPQSRTAALGLVAPELQITNDTSVTGYVNAVRNLLLYGIGTVGNQTGLRLDLSDQRPLARSPAQLVEEMSKRLLGGTMSDALRADMVQTLATMAVPELDGNGSNQSAVNEALDTRTKAAILMAAVSPEFLIQK
ncbi:MAG: DUF1800 domain-containing protein [Rubrivivax sp.]|nr:MAG: DUF1800 domain-containing protein [Rubrivivax sp.]